MAGRDAGQNRTRQDSLPVDRFPGRDHRQAAAGRDAEGEHRLTDDVLPQHRSERGTAVTGAGKRCLPGPFQLDVVTFSARGELFAQQDRATVAEHGEVAELMAGIGLGQRVGPGQSAIPREHFDPLRCAQGVGIQSQRCGQVPVDDDQPGRRYRHRTDPHEE